MAFHSPTTTRVPMPLFTRTSAVAFRQQCLPLTSHFQIHLPKVQISLYLFLTVPPELSNDYRTKSISLPQQPKSCRSNSTNLPIFCPEFPSSAKTRSPYTLSTPSHLSFSKYDLLFHVPGTMARFSLLFFPLPSNQ